MQMLEQVADKKGNLFMVAAKKEGGMAQLRHHVRGRDQRRETEEVCDAKEEQFSEEDVFHDAFC